MMGREIIKIIEGMLSGSQQVSRVCRGQCRGVNSYAKGEDWTTSLRKMSS